MIKWREVALSSRHELEFPDGRTVSVERCICEDQWRDCLRVESSTGTVCTLQSAVDISASLAVPRIFVFEGVAPDVLLTFGGEFCYRLGSRGTVQNTFATFRERIAKEYWTTRILAFAEMLVVVYEAGLLAVNGRLEPLWQRRKYFDDRYAGVEGNRLIIAQGSDKRVAIDLATGEWVRN